MKKVTFKKWKCVVVIKKYFNNRPAIQLESVSGEPVATASLNAPEHELKENEVIIKEYGGNEGIFEALSENGIIKDTGKRVQVGFVTCKVCELLIKE